MLLRLRTALLGALVLLDETLDLVGGATGGGVGEQENMTADHFSFPFMKSTAVAPFDGLKVRLRCGYLKRSFLTSCVRKYIVCPFAACRRSMPCAPSRPPPAWRA
jgi:hypothetical protein